MKKNMPVVSLLSQIWHYIILDKLHVDKIINQQMPWSINI